MREQTMGSPVLAVALEDARQAILRVLLLATNAEERRATVAELQAALARRPPYSDGGGRE